MGDNVTINRKFTVSEALNALFSQDNKNIVSAVEDRYSKYNDRLKLLSQGIVKDADGNEREAKATDYQALMNEGNILAKNLSNSGNATGAADISRTVSEINGLYDVLRDYETNINTVSEEYNKNLINSEYVKAYAAKENQKIIASNAAADDPAAAAGKALANLITGRTPDSGLPSAAAYANSFKITDEWSTDAKLKFYNLYKKDKEEAVKFAQEVNRAIDLGEFEEFSKAHPFWGSVLSLPISFASGFENLGNAANYGLNKLVGNESKLERSYAADIKNALMSGGMQSTDWKVGKHDFDVFDFLYSTANSVGESLVASAIPGGFLMLGLNAAASTTNDILDRGGSDGLALIGGLVAGTLEGVFEKISIGNFKSLKNIPSKTFKDVGKNILKSTAVNASEETLTEAANIVYDLIANGDISNANINRQKYIEQGLSEKEADKQIVTDLTQQVMEAALGGAVSGLFFGAFGSGGNYISRKAAIKQNYSNNPSLLIELANALPNDANIKSLVSDAKVELKNKGKLSGKTLNSLYNAIEKNDFSKIQNAAEARLKTLGEKNAEGVASALVREMQGYELSGKEKNALKNSKYSERVQNELNSNNAKSGDYSSAWVEDIGTSVVNADVYNNNRATPTTTDALVEAAPNLANITAANPPADVMKDSIAKSSGVERLSDGQKTLRKIGQSFGARVEFADLDYTVTDENGNQKVVSPEGSYNRDTNTITLNTNVKDNHRPVLFVLKHELTHSLEKAGKIYEEFMAEVLVSDEYETYFKNRGFETADQWYQDIIDRYARGGKPLGNESESALTAAKKEAVADFVGDVLFDGRGVSLENLLNSLQPETKKTFIEKVKEVLAKLKSIFVGKPELTEIEALEKRFLEVANKVSEMNKTETEGKTGQQKTTTEEGSGVKYSIESDEVFKKYCDKIDEIENNDDISQKGNFIKVTSQTPGIIVEKANVKNLPIAIQFDTAYLETRHEGKLIGNYHNLGATNMKNLPSALESPKYIVRLSNGRLNVIVSMPTPKGKDVLVSIELEQNKQIDGKFDKYNIVITAFGAKDGYISKIINNPQNQILYKKETEPQGTDRLHKGSDGINVSASNNKISQNNANVNQKFSLPELDREYMSAVENGDMKTAQRLVDEAAREAGYDSPKLYHGTQAFGFTRVKTSGVEKGVAWSPFFAANKEDISASYVLYGKVRDISSSMDDDAIEEARENAIEERKENISELVYDFRRLIDRHFSPWVFGQTDNSYLEELVEKANPEAGYGDGVYDVLSEVVYDSFYDYQDEFGEYEDADDWAENSPEGHEIFSKINEIEGEKSALHRLELGEELGGIYQLYANLDNMYVVDGKGVAWNELRPEGLPKIERYGVKDAAYRTRDVAEWARDNGFDGVIFKNIRDNGAYGRTPPGDVYVFFRPESQVKSADPVTYDDKGNVIPLSQRFNEENPDIRYSLPPDATVEQVGDAYKNGEISQEEYIAEIDRLFTEKVETEGKIKRGEIVEPPNKRVPTPKSVSDGTKVRQFARTILESGYATPEMEAYLKELILEGDFSYTPTSNEKTLEKARKNIESQGYGNAKDNWQKAITQSSTGADAVATGEALLILALENNDAVEVVNIAADLAEFGTRTAQSLQAYSLLKRMGGLGQLVYIQRTVNKLNEDLKKRFKKNTPAVTIDPKLADLLAKAETNGEYDVFYAKIMQDIAAQVPPTFLDKWNAWRYMSMLFNPTTHVRNLTGNGIFLPAVRMKDLVALGMERFVAEDQRTKVFKVQKQYQRFAEKDFEEVKDIITGSGKYNPSDAVSEYRRIFKNNVLENARKLNFDLLEKEDIIFLKAHYRHALGSFLQAQKVDIDNISTAQLVKAREYAINEALKATYRDASKLANMMSQLSKTNRGANIILEGVLPFKKTPINIMKRGLDYSPIGLVKTLSKGIYDLKTEKITVSQFIDGLAAGTVGTGVFLMGVLLSSLGVAKGGFDDDEEWFRKLNGEQEYSIEIGGKSYTIDWAAPSSIPFFMGVAISEYNADEDADILSMLYDFGMAGFEPIMSLSMLSGIEDVISSVSYAEEGQKLTTLVGSSIKSYFSQALPTIFGKVANVLDDTRRTSYIDKTSNIPEVVQQALDKIASKTPFASKTRAEYIDAWGETKYTGNFIQRFFQQFVSPGYASTVSVTDTSKEISRLYKVTGEAGVYPSTPKKYVKFREVRKDLSQEEYYNYATFKGQRQANMVDEAINSKEYESLTDEQKAEVIKDIYNYASVLAKCQLDYTYDELSAMVGEDKSGNAILTKEKYNRLDDKARRLLVYEYFTESGSVVKAYKAEKNGKSVVEYFIKKIQKENK